MFSDEGSPDGSLHTHIPAPPISHTIRIPSPTIPGTAKLKTFFPKSSPVIEDWWKHNGCYDREQASGIPYEPYEEEPSIYLEITDNWWDGLSADKKEKVYNEFFEEQ